MLRFLASGERLDKVADHSFLLCRRDTWIDRQRQDLVGQQFRRRKGAGSPSEVLKRGNQMNRFRVMNPGADPGSIQAGEHLIAAGYSHDIQVPDMLVPRQDLRYT